MDNSNVKIRSNIMLYQKARLNEYKYIPGDLVKKIYPEYSDMRVRKFYLNDEQIIEMDMLLFEDEKLRDLL